MRGPIHIWTWTKDKVLLTPLMHICDKCVPKKNHVQQDVDSCLSHFGGV